MQVGIRPLIAAVHGVMVISTLKTLIILENIQGIQTPVNDNLAAAYTATAVLQRLLPERNYVTLWSLLS